MAKNQRQYDAAELLTIVKADPVVVHYENGNGDATLHAPECKHRANEVGSPFSVATLGADDWFYVAPCAKKKPKQH